MSRFFSFISKCTGYLGSDRWTFAVFLLVSVFAVLFEGAGISMVVPLLETVSGGSSFSDKPLLGEIASFFDAYPPRDRIVFSALFIAGLLIVTGILKISVSALNASISIRIRARLTVKIYEYILRSRIEFINAYDRGKLINTVISLPTEISKVVKALGEITYSAFLFSIYTSLMFLISVKMTLFVLFALGIVAFLLNLTTRFYIKRAGENKINALSDIHHITHESMNGLRLIKSLVIENNMIDRLKLSIMRFSKSQYVALVLAEVPRPSLITFAGLLICSLLVYHAYTSSPENTEWLASIFMFIIVLFRLTGPFSSMNVSYNTIMAYLYAIDTYESILSSADQNAENIIDGKPAEFRNKIIFQNVSFKYPEKDSYSLNDVSFSIPRNSVTALVGPSGAGKTTVAYLLCKFYTEYEGDICVDEINLKEINLQNWRKKISFVTQDTFIFDDTLRNNLKIVNPSATDEDIFEIARKVGAYEFIENLPEGLDTRLGDRGMKLSGGQCQRVSLMRSLLEGAEVIVLDEATSQLDSLNEKIIQQTVESLRHQKTVLIIAHRLSTTKNADEIIVMDNGEIVERGTHADLIANDNGLYADLVKHQNIS